MMFHQLEGMFVAEDVSVGNLIYFMKTLLSRVFKKDVEVRLRPGFFPFVEPGFELILNVSFVMEKVVPFVKKLVGLNCFLVEWFTQMFLRPVELIQKNITALLLD